MESKATKIETPISDIGMVNMESFTCDNTEGTIQIVFVRDRSGESRRRIICNFDSFIVFKVKHEDFDTGSEAGLPDIEEPKVEYFGNVLKYNESKWLSCYKNSTLYLQNNRCEPSHFCFISSEDTIEVLTLNFPKFEQK